MSLLPGTGMTSEALGVSVAPSFFHSCVSDGKTATMEDVQRFKVSYNTPSVHRLMVGAGGGLLTS